MKIGGKDTFRYYLGNLYYIHSSLIVLIPIYFHKNFLWFFRKKIGKKYIYTILGQQKVELKDFSITQWAKKFKKSETKIYIKVFWNFFITLCRFIQCRSLSKKISQNVNFSLWCKQSGKLPKIIVLFYDFSPICTSHFSALWDFFQEVKLPLHNFFKRKVVRSKYRFSCCFFQFLNYLYLFLDK